MTRPLAGQAALVSGGSRGIGAAVARRLAEAGADVMVMYRTSRDAAEAVVRSCRMQGVQAFAEQGDVREYEDVKRIVRHSLWNFGHLSVVIHAAGVVGRGLVQDVNDQEYDRVMDTHVRGAFHLVRAALPSLLARRYGRINFLSSIWGEAGGSGEVLYSAAKGAINGLTRALAKELAPSGIAVNAVAPGAVQTDMLMEQLTEDEMEALAEQIPAGRLGTPEDVAGMVCHLCLPESGYVTGQVIHVNGGWYP